MTSAPRAAVVVENGPEKGGGKGVRSEVTRPCTSETTPEGWLLRCAGGSGEEEAHGVWFGIDTSSHFWSTVRAFRESLVVWGGGELREGGPRRGEGRSLVG